ncbi:hypothetical protein J0A71_01g00760 [Encephalitozoon cuniculi]|nr:hypothetical protein J0A71_01g00760 [Encephalitozoon cuniculi]
MLLLLLVPILTDNIEIPRDSFDTLKVGNTYISSAMHDASSWNSVKISFPGYYHYSVKEYEPQKLELIDATQYFGEKEEMRFRVDFETKHCGLIPDAWAMVVALTASSIIMFFMPIKNM